MLEEHLSYETLMRPARLPRPEKRPDTFAAWKELLDAVRHSRYVRYRLWYTH